MSEIGIQLSLSLPSVYVTGQRCLPFLDPKSVDRMFSRGLIEQGKPFYLLKSGDYPVCTWSGTGQMVGWVKEWLAQGGTLAEIEARI